MDHSTVHALRGRDRRHRRSDPLGMLITGYEHQKARIAEGLIAAVLLAAVAVTLIWPAWTIRAGLAAQLFALLLTLVGVFIIIVGVGPQTLPDIVAVLVCGLVIAKRARMQ